MQFVAVGGTEKMVTLEQAGPDVIVLVNGYAVAALRGADGVIKVNCRAIVGAGLSLSSE
jgi:hypothetical protein